jgi:hypothetical protein
MDTTSQCVLAEARVATLVEKMDRICADIERQGVALFGNGKPGLIRDIDSIKTHIGFNQQRSVHERITSIETKFALVQWAITAIGGWAVIQILQFVRDMLTHAIVLTPK